HGFRRLRIDGAPVELDNFKKLDRYREHTIDLVVGTVSVKAGRLLKAAGEASLQDLATRALELGKGSFYLDESNPTRAVWFSTQRSDPVTGEAFPDPDPKDFSWNAPRGWCPTCRGHGSLHSWMLEDERFEDLDFHLTDGMVCPACKGQRLNPVSRAVTLTTRSGVSCNLPDLLALTPPAVLATLENLRLDKRGEAILAEILPEIRERLLFMEEVGLQYLTLDRSTSTLSGGEAQRIRLAAQLGSNLAGALYVLDEPSIGLHERDNERLLESLDALKEKGNSLLIVEHDSNTMQRADHIIDLGPGAGRQGGSILAEGSLATLLRNPASLTGQYLKSGLPHPSRGHYRPLPDPFNPRRPRSREDWIHLREASLRNLKGADILIPRQRLVVVCGVSGSGKSTLVRDLLMPAARRAIREKAASLKGALRRDGFRALSGIQGFRQVIEVDQSPIGKTPRSTPATYIGAFERIRELFAQTPEARLHGYQRGTFSFNTKGGRCESCKGAGRIRLEMNFLPDTYVPCEECQGRRYGHELEEIRWRDASIADVLQMTFEEAAAFFAFDSQLASILQLMVETGLGYLTLGQSSPTLSGGEAQRLKLVSELAKGLPTFVERSNARLKPNLYILEEPTIGLHLHDCERLIHLLHRLVELGHSILVIEHHLDLIAEADYLIEVGPDGG
ncbi:MAG TPA: excinuclease ABC subunit A, partial [Oceanipulchritudo sp.]|nr:excinuclease ABC subunit A [Oceanipulchritudo sp.]